MKLSRTWKLIGNAATVWVNRTDRFMGVVNGNLIKEFSGQPTWNSSTGQTYWKYIKTYDASGRDNRYFMLSFPLGGFDVKGMDKTYKMEPRFYTYPGEIVLGPPGESL